MMIAAEVIFLISMLGLFYIYLGYPLFLSLLVFFRKNQTNIDDAFQPMVSLIIAAYNEESVIGRKIENSLKLDYPTEKFDIIVVSDASTDRTDEVVRRYADQGVKLLRIEGRKGKTYCQNEAVKLARGENIIFSDANSIYEPNAIQKLVRHFSDERIGCVSGELRYRSGSEAVEGEKSYWQYDQKLKQLESRFTSLVTANGAIYAVRKDLYVPLNANVISDFVEPLKIIQKGFIVVYEPAAVAWEKTASDSTLEFRRRVRIVNRSVYSLIQDTSLLGMLNPLRYGIFSIQLFSHKVLRWLSGVFLLLILVLNIFLLNTGLVYEVIMALQSTFYLLAFFGFFQENVLKRKASKLPHMAYYFCLSCYAMLKGLFKGLSGNKLVTWETKR